MPNTNPATAVIAWTTLPRHLGLATDAWAAAGCMQARFGQEQGDAGQIFPVVAFPKNAAFSNGKAYHTIYLYIKGVTIQQCAATYGNIQQHATRCGNGETRQNVKDARFVK